MIIIDAIRTTIVPANVSSRMLLAILMDLIIVPITLNISAYLIVLVLSTSIL